MSGRADGLNDIFDHSIRVMEDMDSAGGTVAHTPMNPKDIVNVDYLQSQYGIIPIVAVNPVSATEGAMILNSTNHSIYIWYLAEWRLLHTITISIEYLLQQNGDFLLLQNGDLIIK